MIPTGLNSTGYIEPISMDMDSEANEFGQWNKSSEDVLKNRYPLHRACRDGDMETLSLLLVSGQQNALVEDEFYGWTPAHWAAYFGKLACVRRIMQVLAMEPMTSRYQQTPAHLAAYSGHPHCLQWLLNTGSSKQQQDYLGETPAHKAARTGSMECISLLAAEQADLNVENNCGMTPAALAARCGYVDCSLYLQRAAEQQLLKRNGVIDDVVLPVMQTQAVLPGQIPDKCVITQGINGGRLPNSIDSHAFESQNIARDTHPTMDMLTPAKYSMCVDMGLNTHSGLLETHTNGLGDHCNNTMMNGALNGFHTTQKDVLLSQDVSSNRAAIAGRKRGREEVDDEPEELKRIKRLEGGDCPENTWTKNTISHLSSSVDEHATYLIAQQGYDSLFIDNLILESYGS